MNVNIQPVAVVGCNLIDPTHTSAVARAMGERDYVSDEVYDKHIGEYVLGRQKSRGCSGERVEDQRTK